MMVHEIQDKRSKKALLGPSTKEGRGLKKSIGRKKVSMHKQLKEMYLWKVIGTGKSIHDSDDYLEMVYVHDFRNIYNLSYDLLCKNSFPFQCKLNDTNINLLQSHFG